MSRELQCVGSQRGGLRDAGAECGPRVKWETWESAEAWRVHQPSDWMPPIVKPKSIKKTHHIDFFCMSGHPCPGSRRDTTMKIRMSKSCAERKLATDGTRMKHGLGNGV